MNKVPVIFWSATGNTEQMANAVAEGVTAAGGTAPLLQPADVTAATLADAKAVAFGCPAMGAEQLEEGEFEPMFSALEGSLTGKRVLLFGSYGWGDGQWMRDWCERATAAGAVLVEAEGLMVNETPDDDALDTCRKLGGELANA